MAERECGAFHFELGPEQVGQLVGVQSMEQNSSDWYGRDARYGLGRRECQNLQQRLQVCSFSLLSYMPCPTQ